MIEEIIFYPNRHEDFEIERLVAEALINDFENEKIDSVFFETNYSWKNLSIDKNKMYIMRFLPDELPLFGAEHKPYHQKHIRFAEEAVSIYKAIKSNIPIGMEKIHLLKESINTASKNRMKALAQNVLLKCSDENYKNPAIVCGSNHTKELKYLFEERGYKFRIHEGYLDILKKTKRKTDYTVRNFSVPEITYSKI